MTGEEGASAPPPLRGRAGVGGLADLSGLAFWKEAGKPWRDPPPRPSLARGEGIRDSQAGGWRREVIQTD